MFDRALFHLGEYQRARDLHREALAFYQSRQQTEGIAWSLERLAVVEAAHGDARKAAHLRGAASVGREGLGKPLDPWDQEDWEEVFASLWAEGRTKTTEQSIPLALEETKA